MSSEQNPPGWYDDPATPGEGRYWTGSEWASKVQVVTWSSGATSAPTGYLLIGGLIFAIGLVFFSYNGSGFDQMGTEQILGLAIMAIGQVMLGVGIVAKGVQVGHRSL